MKVKLAKSPLRYPGGKSRAIAQIHQQMPARIGEYREPLLGGGSVFLSTKSLFKKMINTYWVNDLNHDLYCFWVMMQQSGGALIAEIRNIKRNFTDGRVLFEHFKTDIPRTEFEKAVRFFIMNRITFSGVVDSGGYSQQAYDGRFTESSVDRLEGLSDQLAGVKITNNDYTDLLTQDGQDVFIYLDPPYWSATESRLYGVKGALHTTFDHERFASDMKKCPHRWLITYDDSPHIRDLFSFAKIIEWELQYGMNNYKQTHADKGRELFIRNY
jgi:DNA adenine methylase